MVQNLPELIAFFILLLHGTKSEVCGSNKAVCQQLNGTMNGARCFYVPAPATNWSMAWSTCQRDGGVLAQIHTQSEYESVVKLVSSIVDRGFRFGLWLALRHAYNGSAMSCSTAQSTTYWYNSEAEMVSQMRGENTLIKNHICDENDDQAHENCMFLIFNTYQYTPHLGDGACDYGTYTKYPLCQFNTFIQDYQKSGYCMTDEAFATLQTADVQQCANNCTLRMWCRSFNIVPTACNSLTCQLFSWSALDACSNCTNPDVAPATESCVHYNYVP